MTSLVFPKGLAFADTVASMRTLGDSGASVRRVFIVSISEDSAVYYDRLLFATEKETENGKTQKLYVPADFDATIAELLAVACQSYVDGFGSKRGRVMAMSAYLTAQNSSQVKEMYDLLSLSSAMIAIAYDETTSRPLTFSVPTPLYNMIKDEDDTEKRESIQFIWEDEEHTSGKVTYASETERMSVWIIPLASVLGFVSTIAESIIHAEAISPKTAPSTSKVVKAEIKASMTGLI